MVIDGGLTLQESISTLRTMVTTKPIALTRGVHTVRLEAKNIGSTRTLTLCQQLELYQQANKGVVFEGLIDLKDDPTVYRLVVAASVEPAKEIQIGAPCTGGKPVYFTEKGIEYREDRNPPLVHKVCDLREALSLASLYLMGLHNGIQMMNYWFLFDENNANGVLEGVAWNSETGQLGRVDPHKRPAFHILKAFRWHVFDNLVKADIADAPTFPIGPQSSGMVFGLVFPEETTVPYIQILASKSASGDKVSLFVLNLDPEHSYDIPMQIQGFDPKPFADVFTITGDSPAANNELQDCPSGDCVETVPSQVYLTGNQCLYTFGKHSLTVMVFYRNGSDQVSPAAPDGLTGSTGDGKVRLAWNPNREADLAGYAVYRSRVPEGPFANRINSELLHGTGYLDAGCDHQVTYYYAIKAVDQSGNESPFSQKVSVRP